MDVSIHASVKDATVIVALVFVIICFNPRICKRCDKALDFDRIYIRVSIHASVKDATELNQFRGFSYKVSIHASVKDATFFWH